MTKMRTLVALALCVGVLLLLYALTFDYFAPYLAPQEISENKRVIDLLNPAGRVVAVSRVSLTIKLYDGTLRKYHFCERLANGDEPLGGPCEVGRSLQQLDAPYRYCVSDLAVGDIVHVGGYRINGIDACYYFSIDRRPGGRVPPAPDENDGARHRYHELMQAHQDHEEKGTPLPAWAK
jgi:hypothetical protein